MKKILLFCVLCVGLVSCGKEKIKASGAVVMDQRQVVAFDKIDASNGFDITITMGDDESVVVEAAESLQPYIITSVENGKLTVKVKNGFKLLDGGKTPHIHICTAALKKINASAGSDIECVGVIKSNSFSLNLSGGCDFKANIVTSDMTADFSGGGNIDLSGSAANYTLSSSGGVTMEGYNFVVGRLKAAISGGGTLDIKVTTALEVVASGGSIISYYGDGVVSKEDLSGGSKIIKR